MPYQILRQGPVIMVKDPVLGIAIGLDVNKVTMPIAARALEAFPGLKVGEAEDILKLLRQCIPDRR